ncbi:MAG: hypothetical protein H6Q72_1443 [Firmicutes bacterium]|nr:hypothetical protein [Bacillota bacterium]
MITMCEDNNQGVVNKFLAQFTRKELLAWFVIIDLVAVTVGIAAWKFSQAQEVVDQIGFASSLASIIMAALAIIYAFFQTNASTEQNTLLQLNVQKIGEQVNALSGISTEIAQFRSNFDERMKIVTSLKDEYLQSNKSIQDSINTIAEITNKLGSVDKNDELIDQIKQEVTKLYNNNQLQNEKFKNNLSSFAYITPGGMNLKNELIESISFRCKLNKGYTLDDIKKELSTVFPTISSVTDFGTIDNNPDTYRIQVNFLDMQPLEIVKSYLKYGAKSFQPL